MTLSFNRPSDALSASLVPGCTWCSKTIRTPPLNPSQIDPMACPACGHVPPLTDASLNARLINRRELAARLDDLVTGIATASV